MRHQSRRPSPATPTSSKRSTARRGVARRSVGRSALAVLAGWRLGQVDTRRAAGSGMPVLVPAVAYLGAVAATYVHALDRGFLSNDELDRRLWSVQAVSPDLRRPRAGRRVDQGPPRPRRRSPEWSSSWPRRHRPGGSATALAGVLGDPDAGDRLSGSSTGAIVDFRGLPISGRGSCRPCDDGPRERRRDDRRRVSTAATCSATAASSRRPSPLPGWRSRTSDCTPRRAPSSPSCAVRVSGSSPHRTLSADGSSATSTTAPSNGSSGSPWRPRLMRTQLEREQCTDAGCTDRRRRGRAAPGRRRCPRAGVGAAPRCAHGLRARRRRQGAGARRRRCPCDSSTRPTSGSRRRPRPTAFLVVAEAAKMGPVSVNVARRGADLVVEVDAAGVPPRLVDLEDRVGVLGGTLDHRVDRIRYVDTGGDPVRVVVADDSMLVREGLARLLAEAGCEIVGTASNATELLRHVGPDGSRRRHRRHQDATDVHRRRHRRRRRDPPPPSRRRRARAVPAPRVRVRHAPARRGARARRLPAQGTTRRRRRPRRRAATHRRRRVRGRPDDRVTARPSSTRPVAPR